MNKNNPINSVYLLALALASLMFYVNSFYEALVFTVVVVAVFLFAISVVSMIEKIADKHVKFLTYALVSAALVTILKVIFQFVNIGFIVIMSNYIDIAIVPLLLIGIIPIYFEDSFSVKQFFATAFLMCICFVLMTTIFGLITEIAGYGSILDVSLGFEGLEFFALPHGKLLVIAVLTILFNVVRRTYLKRTRRYRMLVERYKIQIREIQSSEKSRKQREGGEN